MPDPTETGTRRHLWLTLLAVLGLVAAVVVTLIAGRGQGNGSNTVSLIDGRLRLHTFESAQLACPSDPAFSPDGSRLVVLGVLASSLPSVARCSALSQSATPAAYAVAVFDTASGQLIRIISLDAHLLGDPVVSFDSDAPQFAYSGLGWSPDGAHVALAFTEFGAGQHTPENVVDSGLLLLDVMSGRTSVVRGDSGFFATVSGVSSGFPVWHLGRDSELPSFVPPAGLAYAWNSDGIPYPIVPLTDSLSTLPAEAGPRYPIGMPTGGSRFTIWQPGLVIGADNGDADSLQSSFVSAFPAWSPDGAHVTLMVAGVTLDSGAPVPSERSASEAAPVPPLPLPPTLPVVPSRDAALGAVQQQVHDHGWAVVAWNGEGSLLASINCFATHDQSIEVRDTSTGTLLATEPLDLVQGDLGCAAEPDADSMGGYPNLALSLQWSPTGDRLLLSDCAASTLTIYHLHRRPANATQSGSSSAA